MKIRPYWAPISCPQYGGEQENFPEDFQNKQLGRQKKIIKKIEKPYLS